MKRIIAVAATIGLALTFQLVFSPYSVAADNDISGKKAVPYNGITYFEMGGGTALPEGSAAGGPGEISPSKEPFNGITIFSTGSRAVPAESSERESAAPYNGITVF